MAEIEQLRRLEVPHRFSRREMLARGYEGLELTELERLKLARIVEVLDHPELEGLVREGKITFAMIRPRADQNRYDLPDLEAAEAIASDIRKPLEVVFSISVRFDREMVENFYNFEPKERQRHLPPLKFPERFADRWEEFADLMSSGPVTVLLLHSADERAIERWREQLGHWDVDQEAKPGTLRKTWAIDTYNNLLHGSDGPEAVQRELGVLRQHLGNLVKQRQVAE